MTHAPATRIVLVITPAPGADRRLAAAIEASTAASVVIASGHGAPLDAASARPLVEAAQVRGAAALLSDDARLARALGADGVHLSWSADLHARHAEARGILGRGAVVGVDAGRSRHDAMEAAESGADYVAFCPTEGDGGLPAEDERHDLVQWWAEIFEPPVVAMGVAAAEEAQELAGAGADFVAIDVPDGLAPEAAARWLAPFLDALRSARAVA